MISASKSTLSLNNLKILRPKVMKNLTNLSKIFVYYHPDKLPFFMQFYDLRV
jgi:hypothetical protein